MGDYSNKASAFDTGRADQYRAEINRAMPVTEGDATYRHLTQVRGIPPEVVLGCPDLRTLPAPILGRDRVDFACVSLLRPAPDAEPTGAELAFVDILGKPAADEPRRVQWAFGEHGCRDAWFFAGGSGGTVIAAEGFACKPLALLEAGVSGLVMGWGARAWLRHKKLPTGVKKLVIVADRRPAEDELGADGKPLAEGHDRDYRRAADYWLLEIGEDAVLITPDPGALGKDADAVLKGHGAATLRQLVESAVPAKLSPDGWVAKLARMTSYEDDLKRREFAEELGGIRLSTLDGMRKQGQAALPGGEDDTARTRLVAIATTTDLFQDDGGDGYSAVELSGGAQRTFKIEGAAFSDWLIAEYGRRFPENVAGREVPGSVSSSTLADAIRTVLAVARQGDTRKVFLRLGWGGDRLYLDMGTPEPRAIEITPEGWAIVQDPPVHLVFSPTAKPLPVPVPGSRKAVLRQLRKFFGFRLNDDRLILLIGIMLAGLMPRGPYPILILSGEQGSGKTSRSRFIKLAIDPTKANVRGRPKSAEDLAISVWRSWFGLFDNLSKLDQDMSDWLCRLSEGAGLPKRKLYTDSEEILIEAARPIMLTAIPDIAQSGDVIDRAVLIRCDPLPIKIREQALLDQFEAFCPQLLGYLIEATSCALRRYGEMANVHDGLRRGDWCAWVEAAAPALGLPEGLFTKVYKRNQDQAVRMALELDPVAAAAIEFMEKRAEIEIGITLLHSELEQKARKQHTGRLPLDWPSMAHHFSGRLRRVAPMLRRVGIEIEQSRDGAGRSVVRLINSENAPKPEHTSRTGSEEPRQAASGASGASETRRRPNGAEAAEAPEAEKQNSSDAAREAQVGNGADPEARCDYCKCLPADPVRHGRKLYCGDACVQEVRAREARDRAAAEPKAAPAPPPKKSRIRRGVRR